MKFQKGFTLIELLVVIGIIGVLSTVVLASLNSAREKGKIALIKSTLKNLYTQAAVNQSDNGSFTGSNTTYTDLTCSGNLLKIAQPLIDQGIIVKCFSFGGTPFGGVYVGDDYQRFGATALMYDTGELKAWSVDERGVVKWDLKGVTSAGAEVATSDTTMNWATANTACGTFGGRLPSIEQLRTLSHAWYSASISYTPTPTSGGFVASYYWSSIPIPSSPGSLSYAQNMVIGSLGTGSQTNGSYVRCVR
jgi:prepilin-type N-terminal cleavage/methylation domain-containing protein